MLLAVACDYAAPLSQPLRLWLSRRPRSHKNHEIYQPGFGNRRANSACLEVAEYRAGLHPDFTNETIRDRLPAPRDAAFTSLAFNIGMAGAGKSTATRRLNADDIPGACDALTWFNKAGGRVVRGLVAEG